MADEEVTLTKDDLKSLILDLERIIANHQSDRAEIYRLERKMDAALVKLQSIQDHLGITDTVIPESGPTQ